MTITPDQLHALSGYLQWIGFSGIILDPNDHDESIHSLTPLLPADPYIRIYSFKPATNPNVLNGGHLFTYGITAESVDAIVTSSSWDTGPVKVGVMALKPGGLFFLCATSQLTEATQRAMLTQAGVTYADFIDGDDKILIGRKPGGV